MIHPHALGQKGCGYFTPGAELAAGVEGDRHNGFITLFPGDLSAQFHGGVNGRRPQVIHVQGSSDKTEKRFAVHGAALVPVGGGCSRARAVAVDDRRDQSTVDISLHGRMLGSWHEPAHRFLPIPVTFNLEPGRIEPAATVTYAVFVLVVVLECLVVHRNID